MEEERDSQAVPINVGLLLKTLKEGDEYLQGVEAALAAVGREVRQERWKTAGNHLADLADGLAWITKLLEAAQPWAGVDYGSFPEGVSMEERMRRWRTVYEEMVSAIEAADSVMLGDLVEYELPKVIEGQRSAMRMLSEAVSRRWGGGGA